MTLLSAIWILINSSYVRLGYPCENKPITEIAFEVFPIIGKPHFVYRPGFQ